MTFRNRLFRRPPTTFLPWTVCEWLSSLGFASDCFRFWNPARPLRTDPDPAYFVLRHPHRLAGIRYPRDGHAYHHHRWLGAETAQRSNQFSICRRVDYFDLGSAAALSSRISALIFRGALHYSDSSAASRTLGPIICPRPIATEEVASPMATDNSRAGSLHLWRADYLLCRMDWRNSTGRVLLQYCHSCQHARQFAGRAHLRIGADQQSRKPSFGSMVSRSCRSFQSCWLVFNGMHSRHQPLVRRLARSILLCPRPDRLHHCIILRNISRPGHRLAAPTQPSRA